MSRRRRYLPLPDGAVDLLEHQVRRGGSSVGLTPGEQLVLAVLVDAQGAVCSRRDLNVALGSDAPDRSRNVDVVMRRLREKIEVDPSTPGVLITVRGQGYRLHRHDDPVQRERELAPTWRRDIELDDGFVDLAVGMVIRGTERVSLTHQEQRLLQVLGERPGGVVSKEVLARRALGQRVPQRRSRALDRALFRLRQKLEPGEGEPRHLLTVPRQGVRLVAAPPRSNLLPPDYPLLGREEEVRAACGATKRGGVCTLVGMGGVGKTHLAGAVAAELSNGSVPVWWCSLEASEDVPSAVAAVATTLGVPADALTERLDLGELVMVLDNCEQVVGLSDWLAQARAAHDVHWLCTSRIPLGVPGEVLVRVEPLSGPCAVQLYAQRAEALGVHTPPVDQAALAELTSGIPLAVVLCAARAEVASPRELREMLETPLQLTSTITSSPRDRHHSLARVLRMTWEQLGARERRAAVQLAGLDSGASVEQAAWVWRLGKLEAMGVLQTLVAPSLLRRTASPSGTRFTFLPLVRAFLRERSREGVYVAAAAAGEEQMGAWIRNRTCAASLEELYRTRPEGMCACLAVDIGTFLARVDDDDGATAAAAALGAGWGAMEQGRTEVIDRIEGVMARTDVPPSERRRLEGVWRMLRHRRGDVPPVPVADEDLAFDDVTTVLLLLARALRARLDGDREGALRTSREAVERSTPGTWSHGMASEQLASFCIHAGLVGEAASVAQAGVLGLPVGGDPGVGLRSVLAGALSHANRLAEADVAFEEALAAARRVGARAVESNLWTNLGFHRCRTPGYDLEEVLGLIRRGREIAETISAAQAISPMISEAIVWIALDGMDEARVLLGRVLGYCDAIGHDIHRGTALGCLGQATRHPDEANRYFDEGDQLLSAASEWPQLALLRVRRGEVALARGDREAARRALERAKEAGAPISRKSPAWGEIEALEAQIAAG